MNKKESLSHSLQVGDIVFIFMGTAVFRKIARDTGSWTNHVGIVVDTSADEPIIAESKFPFSTFTPFSKYAARVIGQKIEIKRFSTPLTEQEKERLKTVAGKKLGIFYDTSFNLNSKRQFCSRFVHEVVLEATGREIGQIETLEDLLSKNPQATLLFWRLWYLGKIPWDLRTITPASQLASDQLYTVSSGQNVYA